MKYWIGYVVALIFAACTWALHAFAAAHTLLVDMLYPYISRLVQIFLSAKTANSGVCVWQLIVVILGALFLAGVILCIWRKKNLIRLIGWSLAFVSVLVLLSTCLFGLSRYAGPLSDDIRLSVSSYSEEDLKTAMEYYQTKANDLAPQLARDSAGNISAEFPVVAEKANVGFEKLSYAEYFSVFANDTAPVKELDWQFVYSALGKTSQFFPLTGEAAVNSNTPVQGLPFAICRVSAQRISISNNPDSAMAAYLACIYNDDLLYQYSGYFMAYRYCYTALLSLGHDGASLRSAECAQLKQDMDSYQSSFAARSDDPAGKVATATGEMQPLHVVDLLVSWHMQEIIAPTLVEEKPPFDPMDENQVDLSQHPNAYKEEPTEATEGE